MCNRKRAGERDCTQSPEFLEKQGNCEPKSPKP